MRHPGRRRNHNLWQNRRGTAALELALISPLLVMLFLGTVEVTQLIRVKTKLTLATQAIQNMVAGQKSANQGLINNDYLGGQLVMMPFPGASLAIAVESITFDSSGNASTLAWQIMAGGATAMSASTACALAASLSLGSDSVIIVKATYSYTPVVSYLLSSSFTLTQVAYGRPRNTTTISGTSTSGAATGSC